jgi:glycosyltransferase involved in cell wall biosynthesis
MCDAAMLSRIEMISLVAQTISDSTVARRCLGFALLARGAWYSLARKPFRAFNAYCSVVRVAGSRLLARIAHRHVDALIDATRGTNSNGLIADYRADPLCERLALSYSLAGTGPHDLFRDLIVLKNATPREKGVILLKYARTFSAAVALLDVNRLQERYRFVLEPCWAGYCDPALLLFFTPGQPVLVQCFTDEDLEFVRSVGEPFFPLRQGPADWVDASIFEPPAEVDKPYDLVMVANWGRHKRHATLFKALGQICDRSVRVLLIGFPWAGRSADNIRAEASAACGPNVTVEVIEKLPQAELARYVTRSKVFVFLSKKEGDNKALVEAMFANVPAIVYRHSVGGARSRINELTGVLADDDDLPATIRFMLDHYRDFAPRRWAMDNTGSRAATRILDAALREVARGQGEPYEQSIVEKTNAPNLAYHDPHDRVRFAGDYEFILQCLRYPRSVTSLEGAQRDVSLRGSPG